MAKTIAPLPVSFMVTGIIGFFVSVYMVYPIWRSIGFAFALVFALMFAAAVLSMTFAPLETYPTPKGLRSKK